MKNINYRTNYKSKAILVEDAIDMVNNYLDIPKERIEGNPYSKFLDELLLFLHERNIYTINRVGANHLVLLILNLANKYGDEMVAIYKIFCQSLFNTAAIMGIIKTEENPSTFLDKVFSKSSKVILGNYDF